METFRTWDFSYITCSQFPLLLNAFSLKNFLAWINITQSLISSSGVISSRKMFYVQKPCPHHHRMDSSPWYTSVKSGNLGIKSVFIVFQFGFHFLIFPYFIALPASSSTMLNKSCESEHFCLFLNFSNTGFSLSLLNIMLTLGFTYIVYYIFIFLFPVD